MKRLPPPVSAVFLLCACLILSLGTALAEAPKVDLERAKAELAKAKAAKAKKAGGEARSPIKEKPEPEAKPAPAPKVEAAPEKQEKSSRRRLFSRRDRKSDGAKPEKAEATPEPEPASKRRGLRPPRLFRRGDDATKKESEPNADPQVLENPETPRSEDEPTLRRFSPFRRDRDKSEEEQPVISKTQPVEQDEKKTAAVTELAPAKGEPEGEAKPEPKDDGGRGLFGRFSRGRSDDVAKKEAQPAEQPTAQEERVAVADDDDEAKIEPSGRGAVFGWFRRDSKEFAKAEKTKLGKSVESTAAASESKPVAKKRSSAGALGWYVVTEARTPFYAIGPGQPLPPEKMLDRGSMLTVTKGGWGWCNVKLGSGELGVVSSKAMRPATVAEIRRHSNGSATASRSRGSRSLFNILSRGSAPKLDLPTRSASESHAPIRNFGLLPPVSSDQ